MLKVQLDCSLAYLALVILPEMISTKLASFLTTKDKACFYSARGSCQSGAVQQMTDLICSCCQYFVKVQVSKSPGCLTLPVLSLDIFIGSDFSFVYH